MVWFGVSRLGSPVLYADANLRNIAIRQCDDENLKSGSPIPTRHRVHLPETSDVYLPYSHFPHFPGRLQIINSLLELLRRS